MPTKPEAVPDAISGAVGTALTLSELERSGAQFLYPQALSPSEWASLKGLTRGRDRAETLKAKRDRKQRRIDERKHNG